MCQVGHPVKFGAPRFDFVSSPVPIPTGSSNNVWSPWKSFSPQSLMYDGQLGVATVPPVSLTRFLCVP